MLKSWAIKNETDLDIVIMKSALDDTGPYELINPFSLKFASLKSVATQETFSLSGSVPQQTRKLMRRSTDVEGMIGDMRRTAVEVNTEIAEKKIKPKAPMQRLGCTKPEQKLGSGRPLKRAGSGLQLPPSKSASAGVSSQVAVAKGKASDNEAHAEVPQEIADEVQESPPSPPR